MAGIFSALWLWNVSQIQKYVFSKKLPQSKTAVIWEVRVPWEMWRRRDIALKIVHLTNLVLCIESIMLRGSFNSKSDLWKVFNILHSCFESNNEVTCVIRNHCSAELNCIPIRPKEKEKEHHDCDQTVTSIALRGRCMNTDCKSRPFTICVGCTSDIKGFTCICKPSPRKDCWTKVHLDREPYPIDVNGNPIESPSLIKKRRRNSSLGSEKIPKRQSKSKFLNPHHTQVD